MGGDSTQGRRLAGRRLTYPQLLIDAMAAFGSESGLDWRDAARDRPAEVESVLAAYWTPLAEVA